mgnify:CR=1 FL=1
MRKVTKNIVGVLSLGVLATSWSLGQAAETGLSLGAGNTNASPTPTASDLPTTAATPAAPVENGGTAPTSTPTQAPTPTPSNTATTTAASVTKTSAAIQYIAERRTGTMQISVTKSGSKITDVTIISGGTEGGEWASVPGILAQAAIDAQGSNFGNVSRATHTTEAFKKALESALAKF